MRTPLAWCNVMHDKRRTTGAVASVAFAILLVFMQLGFYTGAMCSATLVYDSFDFDAILVSPGYQHLQQTGAISKARLHQARLVPGVASVVPVHVAGGLWRNITNGVPREIIIMAVDPRHRPFVREEINH